MLRLNSAVTVLLASARVTKGLSNDSISGYIVADPFNAVAEVNGIGKILRFTGDVWYKHACCVVVMHEDDVVNKPNFTQAVVSSIAEAQLYATDNRVEAAKLLSKDGGNYLPQPLKAIEYAMTHYDHDEYVPSGAIKHPDWDNERIGFQPFPFPFPPPFVGKPASLFAWSVSFHSSSLPVNFSPHRWQWVLCAHEKLRWSFFASAAVENSISACESAIP